MTLPEQMTRGEFEKLFDALRKRLPQKKTE